MRLSDRHVKYGGYVKATHFISIAAEGDEKPLGALILEEVRKRLGGCGGAEASASAVFNLLSSFGRLHGQEEPAAFGSFDPNSYATYSRRDVQEAAAEASRQARRKRQLEQGPDIGRRTQMAKPVKRWSIMASVPSPTQAAAAAVEVLSTPTAAAALRLSAVAAFDALSVASAPNSRRRMPIF